MEFTWLELCAVASICMRCLIFVSHAREVAPVCGAPGATVVVDVSRKSLKAQFRCGAEFPNVDPPLYSGSVYNDHGCVSPVKLSSRLPNAQLVRSSKVHNLHTFSLTALPIERPQLLYYLCISPDRKGGCKVIINVPADSTVKENGGAGQAAKAESAIPTCSEPGKTVVSYISRASRRAFFKCSPELSELDPPAASGTLYTNITSSVAVPLATVAPGVLVNLDPDDALYVLALRRLPMFEFQSYFYRCVSPVSSRLACTISIVVPPEQASPPAPEAGKAIAVTSSGQNRLSSRDSYGQVGFGQIVRTCSVQETTIVSPLSPHSLSAQFRCAADLSLLDPPVLSGNIYVDKSCSYAVPLRALLGGSLHMSSGLFPLYTLRIKELPPGGPLAVFYKCRSPNTGNACLVEIKLPGAVQGTTKHQVKAPASIPTCSKAGGSIAVSVGVNAKIAQFRCGSSFLALHPPVTSGKAYITRSCEVPVSVHEHVGGGITLSKTNTNLYTVSLRQLPKEESKTFYYLCKELSGPGACRIAVSVPRNAQSPSRVSQAKSSKRHVCHAGPDAAIRVTIHAHERIDIKCAPGLRIEPHSTEEVFDNTDGTCSGLSTLHSLLSGAQLLPTSTNVENSASRNHLAFVLGDLPDRSKELCYHCASSAHAKAHDCKILISVPGRELSGDSKLRGEVGTYRSNGARTLPGVTVLMFFAALVPFA